MARGLPNFSGPDGNWDWKVTLQIPPIIDTRRAGRATGRKEEDWLGGQGSLEQPGQWEWQAVCTLSVPHSPHSLLGTGKHAGDLCIGTTTLTCILFSSLLSDASCGMWLLVSWPGINPMPTSVGTWSLNTRLPGSPQNTWKVQVLVAQSCPTLCNFLKIHHGILLCH